jgi:hypothetical protein
LAEYKLNSPLEWALYSFATAMQYKREGRGELTGLSATAAVTAHELVKRTRSTPPVQLADALCFTAYTAWLLKTKDVALPEGLPTAISM